MPKPPVAKKRPTKRPAVKPVLVAGNDSTATVAKRPSGRRSQRAEILGAAVDLFAKGGSRGTPLAAIAERIGVSVPAITHHFGSKYGLFMEVVAVSDSADEMRLIEASHGAGIERLGSPRSWARTVSSDPSLVNLERLTLVMTVEAVDADFPFHDHFVARQHWIRQTIIDKIERGRRDGSIRPDVDSLALAVEVLAFMHGANLQWHLDPESIDLVKAYDGYFDRLLHDLAPSATAPLAGGRTKRPRGRSRSRPKVDAAIRATR
jgi:AcrR family transcriptional regulator